MTESKQAAPAHDNITSGPISRTILSLATPVVMAMLMQFALTSTDYYWVGKLGATAQDAVTSAMVVMWTIYALINIISVGVTALVARYVGARDFSRVTYYVKQGMALALWLGTIFTVSGYSLAPQSLKFMDAGPATLELAVPYLRVFFLFSFFSLWQDTVYAVFRASGDTRTPTLVGVASVLVNMGLDPILIFGLGPFPTMGVLGASLATGISVLLAAVAITIFMLRGKLGYRVERPFALSSSFAAMIRITKIGLPIASQQLIFIIVYWFLIKVVHVFGETAAAAMGIGNRMESFSYLTCYGFGVAAATMVGQNLGAGKPDRAGRCAWGATGIAIAITAVTTILFIVFPKYIATVFTGDPEVLAIAVDYLIILGISQTAMAVEIVLEGAFGGAGDTLPPTLVQVPLSLARIPLAYWLALNLGWGINGVWWTLTFTAIAKGAILALLLWKGNWKKKQV